MIKKLLILSFLSLFLSACITQGKQPLSPSEASYLSKGKREFKQGHYKEAMRTLLPLASNNVQEAQYAVGYLYYYGYGTEQDKDLGLFWIKRAAKQKFMPAIKALRVINNSTNNPGKSFKDQKNKKRYAFNNMNTANKQLNMSIKKTTL